MQTKHLIFGAGLIGSYLAGCFYKNNNKVNLIGRENSKSLFSNGFKLSDYKGSSFETSTQLTFIEVPIEVPVIEVQSITSPFKETPQNQTFDIIWLTVKCTSIDSVIEPLQSLVNSSSIIICCQNGFGSEQSIQGAFPNNKVISAIVGFNVIRSKNNHWHRSTEGTFVIEKIPQTKNFKQLLQNDLLPIRLSDNIQAERWAKLQLNLANAVNALANIPIKQMLENRDYRLIIAQLMRELLSVTNALNLNLPKISAVHGRFIPTLMSLPNFIFKCIAQKMLTIDPQARTSMWHDLQNKRKTEIDFINGAVSRNAKKIGINSPYNDALIGLVKSVEQNENNIDFSAQELTAKLELLK